MAKFGIGARVVDDWGDKGTIVAKRKGERQVKYDSAEFNTTWWEKGSLTPIDDQPVVAAATTYVPNVGDRVRLKEVNTEVRWGDAGECGTVLSVNFGDTDAYVQFDTAGAWHAELARLEPAAEQWVPKVGDRVRVIDEAGGGKIGDECVVTLVNPANEEDGLVYCHLDGVTGGYQGLYSHRIEPVVAPATTAEPAFQIEAGKFYRTRDGRKVGPILNWSRGTTLFHVQSGTTCGNVLWNEDGTPIGDREPGTDLIAEWVDEPVVAVEAVAVAEAVEVKVGDRVWDVGTDDIKCNEATVSAVNREGEFTVNWDDGYVGDVWWSLASWGHHEPAAPPAKFKVGDRVRIVSTYYGNCFGTVSKIEGIRVYANDWTEGCETGWMSEDSLELAPAEPTFKVGGLAYALEDYVPGRQFTKGKAYTIRNIEDNGGWLLFAEDDGGSTTNGWGASHFSPVPITEPANDNDNLTVTVTLNTPEAADLVRAYVELLNAA